MSFKEFILSNKRNHCVIRHLVLWILYCFFSFLVSIEINTPEELRTTKIYEISLMRTCCFLPTIVLRVYIFIYILIPKYIQSKRYLSFLLAAIAITLFCFVIDIFPAYIFMKFSAPDFDANKLPIWVFLIDWNMLVKGIFASGVA